MKHFVRLICKVGMSTFPNWFTVALHNVAHEVTCLLSPNAHYFIISGLLNHIHTPMASHLASGLHYILFSYIFVDQSRTPRIPYRISPPAGILEKKIIGKVGYGSVICGCQSGHYPGAASSLQLMHPVFPSG